jgi:hypothetical protein
MYRKFLARRFSFSLFSLIIAVAILSGCGGGGSSTPTNTAGTPPPTGANPVPAPTPSPTPTPIPNPTPQPANPGMYQVQLVSNEHSQVTVGQVSVDPVLNNGDMVVMLNQVVANTQLFVQFCPFGMVNQNCIMVGNLMTDVSGNADAMLKFPKPGTWAGVFSIGSSSTFDPASQALFITEPAAFSGNFGTTQSYRVGLQPENNVTGGLNGITTTPAPLTSGFVSEVGPTLHAEIHGATPNTQYDVGFCPNTLFGSGCNQFANNTFTTDASGNGSVDMTVVSAGAEVFFVDVHNTRGQGYVTAFVVQ